MRVPTFDPPVALLLTLGVAFVSFGCGGHAPPVTPLAPRQPKAVAQPTSAVPLAQAPEEEKPQEPFAFAARASGTTEGQAYDAARRRLLVALLNDESLLREEPYSNRLLTAVHDRDVDPIELHGEPEGVEVAIGLRAPDLEAALARLERGLEEVDLEDVPGPLRPAIRRLRETQLLEQLCLRRQELLEEQPCTRDAQTARDAKKELETTLRRIALEPAYDGEIPASTKYLRPLRLTAFLAKDKNEPLARLPLIITWPDEKARHVLTDAQGQLAFDLPEQTPVDARFEVGIAAIDLVGVDLDSLKLTSLELHGRQTSFARAALVASEENGACQAVEPVVRRALSTVMTERPTLELEDIRFLRSASHSKKSKSLPRLADKYDGSLDVVLLLEAESEFASRMGTHRVWFEARGRLLAFDAWTGVQLLEVDSVVTESGVGESRAERAAREALGHDLASKFRAALKERREPPPR